MKFDIGDVNQYEGEDLVFVIGAPGSRWTQIWQQALVFNKKSNNTDWTRERSSSFKALNHNNEETRLATHYGAFWGPGNFHGKRFDHLDKLTKEEIVDEFMQPYTHWDGVKIIKSHWFAYFFERLEFLFPKATFISAYQSDFECFGWWSRCGGWAINYGGYSWYENDTRMLEKIKEENYNILKFNIDRDVGFERMSGFQLLEKLSYLYDKDDIPDIEAIQARLNRFMVPKIAVYNKFHNAYIPSFGSCKVSSFTMEESGLLDYVYQSSEVVK